MGREITCINQFCLGHPEEICSGYEGVNQEILIKEEGQNVYLQWHNKYS